jgi:hypothetical protein
MNELDLLEMRRGRQPVRKPQRNQEHAVYSRSCKRRSKSGFALNVILFIQAPHRTVLIA